MESKGRNKAWVRVMGMLEPWRNTKGDTVSNWIDNE